MLTLALCIASVAAPAVTGNAPASLAGHELQYHISQGTGVYSRFEGRDYLTSFTVDGHYVDSEVDGAVADVGTYTYRVTGPNTSEAAYHMGAESLLQAGGDYSEQFVFLTPTSGTVTGSASTEPATYKGKFSIKQ